MATDRDGWRTALEEFVRQVRKGLGERLEQVLLYGSHARGEATEGSDLDVLVILREAKDYWSDFERVTGIAAQVSLEHDLVLSALPVPAERWRESEAPFYRNVRREGRRVG